MGVWRKWIFPILRLVVFAAVAVALVKIAFFADAEEDTTEPTAMLQASTVSVERGSIVDVVEIDATVEADAAVTAKSTLDGDVRDLFVTTGQHVDAGAVLATIRKEIPQDPVSVIDEDGNETVTQPPSKWVTNDITAPSSGTISELPVVTGQVVAVGDTIAKVAPSTYSVTGTVQPADLYRLVDAPSEANVDITDGPGGITCTGLTISNATPGDVASPDEETGETSSGPVIRCAVPSDVTVFSGLAATLTVETGSVDDALVVPVTAVTGLAGTGTVWVVDADGAQEEREVELGLTDGTWIEVVSGLDEGEQVLEFVPGASSEECTYDEYGNEYCDDGSGMVVEG